MNTTNRTRHNFDRYDAIYGAIAPFLFCCALSDCKCAGECTQRPNTMTKPNVFNGCSYKVHHADGTTDVVRILGYNAIDRLHQVVCNGKQMRMNLAKCTISKHRPVSKKTSTQDIYLYLCDIGNSLYKIGVSGSPDRREKQIRTYSGKAIMRTTARIPTKKSAAFRSFEKAVLERFSHGRTSGGTEVLRLNSKEVDACSAFMKAICARA